MELKNLHNVERFQADKMVKASIFATDKLFYDLYCLEAGQSQKVHSHDGSDKVYLLLDGSVIVTIGDEEKTIEPHDAVLAPAGVPHGVRNDSGEKAVLLVVTTPPPKK
jgi:mannose-6-phosphate isomerase-like protein (cupin superfamily)